MDKIAILYSYKSSDWLSCIKIVRNLFKAYQKIEDIELIPFNYEEVQFEKNPEELVDSLYESQPDKIVFLDHKPHPSFLLIKLFAKYNSFEPELIFHLYGDFTLDLNMWFKLNKYLVEKKVKFVCSSDRQVSLVKKFVRKENLKNIYKVPFPVDENEFHFKEADSNICEKFDIDKDDKVLLYTGRLSCQKNIIDLIKIFEKYYLENDPKVTLLFAGNFDDLGFPFADVYHNHGEYFRIFKKFFNKVDPRVQEKIKFLGLVDAEELNQLYNYAQAFVSFSTYHDEDYGMSVAEAGCCGSPVLLTDWAGFHSFLISKKYSLGIKTKLADKGPTFDKKEAIKKLEKIINLENIEREKISHQYLNHFSIDKCSKLIKKCLENETKSFGGVSDLLIKIARTQEYNPKVFFDFQHRKMNNIYKKVYDVYATGKKN